MNAKLLISSKTKQRKSSNERIRLESYVVIHQQNMSRPTFVAQMNNAASKPASAAQVRVLHHRDWRVLFGVKLDISRVVNDEYTHFATQSFNSFLEMQNFGDCRLDIILAIERCDRERKPYFARYFCRRRPFTVGYNYPGLLGANTHKETAAFAVSKVRHFERSLAARCNTSRGDNFFSLSCAKHRGFDANDFDSTRTSCKNRRREIFDHRQTPPSTCGKNTK